MSIYLYVKTHSITGLKYLGKTTKTDPHSYTGSGKYWKHHLKEHGYDYTTEILCECQSEIELREKGLYYSNLWNVVKSNEWANLKKEEGDGGAQVWSEDARKKVSNSLKGRVFTEEHRKRLSEAKRGKPSLRSDEAKAIAAAKASAKLKGRKKPEGFGDKIRLANIGRIMTEEDRNKMKASWTPERRADQAERRRIQNSSRMKVSPNDDTL